MGFEVVAVNILELAISPGLDPIARVGGLRRFTGWGGTICALILPGHPDDPPRSGGRDADGWRARHLPIVTGEQGDDLTVRWPVDGSVHRLSASALARAAADLGATEVAEVVPAGRELTWWRAVRDAVPGGWVVSAVPADAAREGLYRSEGAWRRIDAVNDAATPGPLDTACSCRACQVAAIGYVAHLWRQHEITASHLLGWHNLHQVRLLIEHH
jgi:hypothetical protein